MFWRLLHEVLLLIPKSMEAKRDVKKSLFWSANQRFFRQMLMAGKVKRCSILAKQAIDDGQCVVIGLQSTGEANAALAKEEYGDESDDLVSAPRMVLLRLIKYNLFNFKQGTNFGDCDIRKLQAIVFRSMQEWAKLPSCDVESIIVQREEQKFSEAVDRRQNLEEKRRLKEVHEAMEIKKRAEAAANGYLSSSSYQLAASNAPLHPRSAAASTHQRASAASTIDDDGIDEIVEVNTNDLFMSPVMLPDPSSPLTYHVA